MKPIEMTTTRIDPIRQVLAPWTLASVLMLSACGGGGGGGSGGGGGGGGGASLNGQFIDALTTGVQYTASGAGAANLTGTTDANGQFTYFAGQTVAFALPTGGGTLLQLGAAQPVAPASGNAVVFVGGMNNALQVAQVLQSLNHAAAAGAIDVSGLTISTTDFTNLNAFITSGGTAFGSAANYNAMMQSAQSSARAATPGLTFVYPGGASPAQASANLATAAGSLTPPTSINLTGLYLYEFVGSTVGPPAVSVNQAGMTQFPAGSANSGTDTAISAATGLQSASTAHSESYSVSGNMLTVTRTKGSGVTEVTSVTFTYSDPSKFLFNISVADNGTAVGSGTGSAYRLAALAPGDVAGRTLTFSNVWGGCTAGASRQIAISMSGTSFTSYCSNSSTATGSGTVSAGPTGISAVQISFAPTSPDTIGNTYLLALVSGSVAANGSGTMAVLATANEASVGVSGLFAFTAQ